MNTINRRKFLKTSATVAGGLAFSPLISCSGSRGPDMVIRNASILDGLGNNAIMGDIAIERGIITSIGEVGAYKWANIEKIIDAKGMTVAPGFIDIHTHTDNRLITNPQAESKLFQGVTLDVGGNCGGSPFPRILPDVESASAVESFTSYTDYKTDFARQNAAINFTSLVGHGTLRRAAMGSENRKPTSSELELMKSLLNDGLEKGATGLSSGLEYAPGGFSEIDELVALCEVVAQHNRLYATHMRSEDIRLVEGVEEALEVARRSGVKLQISHFKAVGKPNWHKVETVIDLVEKARADGIDVECDRYPYLAYSTGMSLFLPLWAKDGGNEAMMQRLESSSERAKMKEETEANAYENGGWDTVMIANAEHPDNQEFIGMRVNEAAEAMKLSNYETVCELLIREEGSMSIVGFGMSEENTSEIISKPYVMIGSDGVAMSPEMAINAGRPHPRSFGTFPRAIRKYVREQKLLTLPEMIRKITSMPADRINQPLRGRLANLCAADIVIFDPETITDKATFFEPWHLSEGISHVIVNGELAIDEGKQTSALPGTVV